MKFRLPQGMTRLSHAGKVVTTAADGTVQLDADAVALLEPHGIMPVGDPSPSDPARVSPRRTPAKPAR